MLSKIKKFFWHLSSLQVGLACLSCFFIIVLTGTLAQIDHGIYYVQKQYFQSLFIYWPILGYNIPIFPGGGLVGTILVLNIALSTAFRLRWTLRNTGLIIVHLSLLVLLSGAGLTALIANESQLYLKEGEKKFFSEHLYKNELVIMDVSNPKSDFITAVPISLFSNKKTITHQSIPFTIYVEEFHENAQLRQSKNTNFINPDIQEGIGKHLIIKESPVTTSDDKRNNPTAIISFKYANKQTGNYLVSLDINGAQKVLIDNRTYYIFIQPKRFYFPFFVELKKFTETFYPGSSIPKDYSSLVQIDDFNPPNKQDVLIYMNNPLRHKGYTFYQASFGKDVPSSVLQVVHNPAWYFPYVSSCFIAFGMILHFMIRLINFRRKSETNS
jgi:hypothetical protein